MADLTAVQPGDRVRLISGKEAARLEKNGARLYLTNGMRRMLGTIVTITRIDRSSCDTLPVAIYIDESDCFFVPELFECVENAASPPEPATDNELLTFLGM